MRLPIRLLLFGGGEETPPIAPSESAALREEGDNELQEDGDISLREQ